MRRCEIILALILQLANKGRVMYAWYHLAHHLRLSHSNSSTFSLNLPLKTKQVNKGNRKETLFLATVRGNVGCFFLKPMESSSHFHPFTLWHWILKYLCLITISESKTKLRNCTSSPFPVQLNCFWGDSFLILFVYSFSFQDFSCVSFLMG